MTNLRVLLDELILWCGTITLHLYPQPVIYPCRLSMTVYSIYFQIYWKSPSPHNRNLCTCCVVATGIHVTHTGYLCTLCRLVNLQPSGRIWKLERNPNDQGLPKTIPCYWMYGCFLSAHSITIAYAFSLNRKHSLPPYPEQSWHPKGQVQKFVPLIKNTNCFIPIHFG